MHTSIHFKAWNINLIHLSFQNKSINFIYSTYLAQKLRVRVRVIFKLSLKVKHAEESGALGVILYPDPLDYANNNTEAVYPSTWWLPGWAIHSHHVRYTLMGDPQSPGYPSLGIGQVNKYIYL